MQKLKLRKIRFGSFVKLFAISGVGFGILVGIIGLIVALVGGDNFAEINLFGNTYQATGIVAGLIGLALGPIVGSLCLAIFGIFCFPGFAFFLLIFRSVKINAKITEVVDKADKKAGKISKKEEEVVEPAKAAEDTATE